MCVCPWVCGRWLQCGLWWLSGTQVPEQCGMFGWDQWLLLCLHPRLQVSPSLFSYYINPLHKHKYLMGLRSFSRCRKDFFGCVFWRFMLKCRRSSCWLYAVAIPGAVNMLHLKKGCCHNRQVSRKAWLSTWGHLLHRSVSNDLLGSYLQ